MITFENILSELAIIEANADAVKSQCYTLRKKMEQATTPNKSSKELEKAIAKITANRRKVMFKHTSK